MREILLIGGGGHCRSVIDVIETGQYFVVKGIVQPQTDGAAPVLGYPILGEDSELQALLVHTPRALVTVGQIKSPDIRRRLFEQLKNLQADLPVVRSPHAYISSHAQISAGTVVMHGAVINANARIGENCIINSRALVEHDARIGDHCHVATGALVNGGCVIGEGGLIGSGAVLKQGVRIGRYAVVGMGAVVRRDVTDGDVVR